MAVACGLCIGGSGMGTVYWYLVDSVICSLQEIIWRKNFEHNNLC